MEPKEGRLECDMRELLVLDLNLSYIRTRRLSIVQPKACFMRKSLLSLIVGLGVLLATLCDDPAAYAQRRVSGGGSSGRSYSSGSSSSSRSSSSRSTPAPAPRSPAPSRPVTPAPSRPSASGKSFSSGSQSTPVASSPKKSTFPASSTPEKKNTSPAPRQNFPANSTPRSATFDEAAAAAQKREQSRVAYTNKSSSSSSAPAAASPPPIVRTSGKTYSKNGFDSAAAQAQRREESRIVYQAGTAPKPTYRTPGGIEKPIEPKAPQVDHARQSINPDLWRTRGMRTRVVYGPYYGRPPVVYDDPYNSFFWYWLLSQSLDSQASWTYHHRYVMDRARYNDLLNRNASLAARVNQLEENKVVRDTSFTPPGIDPDLMYNDNYLDAAFNPTAVETDVADRPEVSSVPAAIPRSLRVARALKAFLQGVFAIAATATVTFFLIWLIFVKRWGGEKSAPTPARPRRRSRR
jgi:hypothetical protein